MAASCCSVVPWHKQVPLHSRSPHVVCQMSVTVLLSISGRGRGGRRPKQVEQQQQQQQQQQRRVLLSAFPHENHTAGAQQPILQQRWIPPEAWISAVASALPTVDVDSMPAYTELLQECLVLQPGLLLQHPRQAAASLLHLERCLRGSAVWLGPGMVAEVLVKYNPDTLAVHLAGLMQVWLTAGGSPHGFGSLWLEAPHALLKWNGSTFAEHLQQLQQYVPDMPIVHLLCSSGSLASALLSLLHPEQLQGCVHRAGGYLLITPRLTEIIIKEEAACSQSDRQVVAVYGCYQSLMQDESSSSSSESCSNSSSGVYGWRQTTEAAEASRQQRDRWQQPSTSTAVHNNSSTSSNSSIPITTQTWQGVYGHQQQNPRTPKQNSIPAESSAAKPDWSERRLLMQLDVRPPGAGLMPVLILPPQHLQPL